MRIFIIIISFIFPGKTFSQNFILPDGEYMDTVFNPNLKCGSYNAYYYSVAGKYPQSSSTLLKNVQLFLGKKSENFSGSGYITFRFTVDCEAKLMQRIQVMQTDEKYTGYHFNKELVNELFAFLKTLDQWKTARSKAGETFSYKAFITFKIKNGKVINIIP